MGSRTIRLKSRAEQRKRIKRRRIVSLSLLALLALSSPLWSGWLTNLFAKSLLDSWTNCNLKTVRYEGLQYLTSDSLEIAAQFPYGESMFEIEFGVIQKRLLDLPWTKSVTLTRKLPDCVVVSVTERVPIATVRSDRMYALTANGVALPVPAQEWVWNLPMITPANPVDIQAGKLVEDKLVLTLLSQVVSVKEASSPLYANLSEVYYHKNNIRATLLDPPVILKMNSSNEHRTWIALNELLKQQNSVSTNNKIPTIIDLRIPGNIVIDTPTTYLSSQESSGT